MAVSHQEYCGLGTKMDEGVDEELHVEITTNMRQDNDIKTMHPDMEINEFISSQSRG